MMILISCAKTMRGDSGLSDRLRDAIPSLSLPKYIDNARYIISQFKDYSAEELAAMLKVNGKIARENYTRFQTFGDTTLPAIMSYDGAVFKNIGVDTLSKEDLEYANEHLRITSFVYGLLRPFDGISLYRMEGSVHLPETDEKLFDYWKARLTDNFIEEIKARGGVLYNLASSEMKRLFDWRRIEREVEVITPTFQSMIDGELKTNVMHTKMARGQMTRSLIIDRG